MKKFVKDVQVTIFNLSEQDVIELIRNHAHTLTDPGSGPVFDKETRISKLPTGGYAITRKQLKGES